MRIQNLNVCFHLMKLQSPDSLPASYSQNNKLMLFQLSSDYWKLHKHHTPGLQSLATQYIKIYKEKSQQNKAAYILARKKKS